MKALLGLTHQLDEIDYTSPHFVHADLDLNLRLQGQKGENFYIGHTGVSARKTTNGRGQLSSVVLIC